MAEAKDITELSLEELAEAGYESPGIASSAKLPQQLVEEGRALRLRTTGGEGGGA